ncbi:hypothetical protein [Armatimonas sp.]|uniref:hypothetical protein n=1 Tax=Armatimonas sp. TaxID=1872638 RepID=UPI00286A83AD|nr:hypothetical protein [Armatimonas sp.]
MLPTLSSALRGILGDTHKHQFWHIGEIGMNLANVADLLVTDLFQNYIIGLAMGFITLITPSFEGVTNIADIPDYVHEA